MRKKEKEMSSYEYGQVNQFIYKLYFEYGRGLEFEECRAIAFLAYAEVRHEIGDIYNREILWLYAKEKIIQAFIDTRRVRNDKIRLEGTVSLNQTYGDSEQPLSAWLSHSHGEFTNAVCLWNDMRELDEELFEVMRMLYRGEEDEDIIRYMKIPTLEYYEMKRELQEYVKQYIAE